MARRTPQEPCCSTAFCATNNQPTSTDSPIPSAFFVHFCNAVIDPTSLPSNTIPPPPHLIFLQPNCQGCLSSSLPNLLLHSLPQFPVKGGVCALILPGLFQLRLNLKSSTLFKHTVVQPIPKEGDRPNPSKCCPILLGSSVIKSSTFIKFFL